MCGDHVCQHVISFCECFRRRGLKPMNDIVVSFVKSLQLKCKQQTTETTLIGVAAAI